MISSDFAPNEAGSDALSAIRILFRPWIWKKGKATQRVKLRLRAYFPASQIFLFLTARAGIYHLLRSLNLPDGSKVLIQAFTCEAVVLPILANNMRPQYVDIETQTFSMSLKDLEKKYTTDSRVLILQHTFSLTPQERLKILDFAKSKKLFVIEDLAQGFNLNLFKIQNSKLKIQNSAFLLSFGRSKMLSSIFGGAVITSNEKVIKTLTNLDRSLEYPSLLFIFQLLLYKPLAVLVKKTYSLYLGIILHKLLDWFGIFTKEVTHKEKRGEFDPTFNKSYPNALAKLLLVQINKLERNNNIRSSIYAIYNRTFGQNSKPYSLIRYPVLVNKRERLLKLAKKQKIYLGTWHDPVVSPKGVNLSQMLYKKGSCPVAEAASREIVNLPTLITQKEAEKVIKLFASSSV